jgi:hypothetical protein
VAIRLMEPIPYPGAYAPKPSAQQDLSHAREATHSDMDIFNSLIQMESGASDTARTVFETSVGLTPFAKRNEVKQHHVRRIAKQTSAFKICSESDMVVVRNGDNNNANTRRRAASTVMLVFQHFMEFGKAKSLMGTIAHLRGSFLFIQYITEAQDVIQLSRVPSRLKT